MAAPVKRCFVIAGLDPAIHAALPLAVNDAVLLRHLSMDHRVKPGGDEVWERVAR